MIIDDYLEYTRDHKLKYGDKCIVLIQVGSFYEIYSIKDDTEEDIYCIADICNIQVSKKNKTVKEVSINNPLMAGFPLYTIKKFTGILLSHNYTIVLVEQVSEPPNPERKITEVLSPGMNMNITGKKSNYLMVIYYEYIENMPIVGIAGVDLTTGTSFVFETGSTKSDPELTNDEVYRIISIYNPCEIVILSDRAYSEDKKHYLIKSLNLDTLVHMKWQNYEFLEIMKKHTYQVSILEKSFANGKNMLSVIEFLDIERHELARIALCCLLQFSYEHNADIIKKITPPEVIDNNMYLNIEYNSSLQLNLIGQSNDRHLVSILDRCSTQFGSRAFRERLLKPIVDTSKLRKRYDAVEHLMTDKRFREVSRYLSKILDLERIKRKMLMSKIHPQDWGGFNTSIENAIDVVDMFYSDIDTSGFKSMKKHYDQILDIDEASKYNINDIKGNIFKPGVFPEVDEESRLCQEAYERIEAIVKRLNSLDASDATSCKIDYNDKEGFFVNITKKRLENARKIDNDFIDGFQSKSIGTSNNMRLVNSTISSNSNIFEEKRAIISKKVQVLYGTFVADFIEMHNDTIDTIIRTIIDIDISACNARNAFEFRYYRPIIESAHSSFVKAENIRHPIIERINESSPYVCNDIELHKKNGLLLYGINSAGKSCLMKAIGLNIVMAQAGMFVPSSKMTYNPYKHIFTRISGMDNIYKGMSSFIVEMTELRNILQRSNRHSLVLGDEICSGTEATSAISIVASGIDCLVNNGASFIFATHLHELTDIAIVKRHMVSYIDVKHIHIEIDRNNRIVYERKLKDGRGHSTYGIEVCKSLDMPAEFMLVAENVRKETTGMDILIVEPVQSKYNPSLYMTGCVVCGEKAVDTHHIKYQCQSDEDGFFRDFHKNIKHNLAPLCKTCHDREHNGSLDIKGYKETTDGIVLHYEEKSTLHEANTVADIEELKMFIKRGKVHWYTRASKTSPFKRCNDTLKVSKKVAKIVGHSIALDDDLCNKLYDPLY